MLVTTSGMVYARAVKDYSGPMLALTYYVITYVSTHLHYRTAPPPVSTH
jgi:hypothetical protein